MPSPTIDDAIQLLTDPANRAMRRPVDGLVEMRPPATVGALQVMGADQQTARELVAEAAQSLGGFFRVEHPPSRSIGRGRMRVRELEAVWIPEKALRDS